MDLILVLYIAAVIVSLFILVFLFKYCCSKRKRPTVSSTSGLRANTFVIHNVRDEEATVVHDVDQIINELQNALAQDTSPNKEESISKAQRVLLLRPFNNLDQLAQECSLIIGVDATPATLAGYIVILKERRLEYYVIKRNELPWKLHAEKDPSEFEMKNFMFALTVWKDIILKYRRLAIYTDNFAITQAPQFDENDYGKRASKLLSHYIKCEGVFVVNLNSMAINKNKKLKRFAMYLQPADDLSRWQISTAIKFLMDLYGIDQENVQGTHYLAWVGANFIMLTCINFIIKLLIRLSFQRVSQHQPELATSLR